MKQRSALKSLVYDILEVAPPANRISRFIQRMTILLVCLNTLALLVSFLDFLTPNHVLLLRLIDVFKPKQIYLLGMIETLSTAFFAMEYILRLWSAPASPRFRGRLRFGFRFFLLIDLVAILPLAVVLFTPSREVTLNLLRLGWGLRHLKLLRYLRQRPVLKASGDALLQDTEAQLVQLRQHLAKGRELDLARVNQSIEAISRQGYEAARHERESQRNEPRHLWPLAQHHDAAPSPILALLDDLEADLTDSGQLTEVMTLITAAYKDSADVFSAAPRRATVQVALDADGLVGDKPVPLRRIGRYHFTSMASSYPEGLGIRNPLYVADVRKDLARIRTAMASALDHNRSQDGNTGLTRAINQLRDLDSPVRIAWDDLLYQLEDEHQKRLQAVRTDIARYGSLRFYLGHLWYWLCRRLAATRRLLDIPPRLWTLIQRLYRDSLAVMTRILWPVLQRLGLIKTPTIELLRAFDKARLDSVLERGLPADYLVHFEFAALNDEELFLGFDEELANINTAIQRWKDHHQSSFIIYGHRGVGKSTLLNMARQRLLADDPVTHDIIVHKMTTPDALAAYLAKLLDCPGVGNFEALADTLLAGPPCAILLEDCHHLFFRNIGGFEAIRYLFWLIAKTNHHILWGISLEKSGYDFLNQALPLNALFHVQIGMHELNGEDLRRLIMMRHNRSGFSLHYTYDKRNAKAVRRHLKALQEQRRSGRANRQEALELAFFDGLATACAGNITVALFHWLRSLQAQGADRYAVQPFEALDLSLIWEFSQNDAFLLVALLQHGKLTAEELAKILDADDIDVRLELEILINHNVLQLDYNAETLEVNPVVLKTVCDMLQSRNLLH